MIFYKFIFDNFLGQLRFDFFVVYENKTEVIIYDFQVFYDL